MSQAGQVLEAENVEHVEVTTGQIHTIDPRVCMCIHIQIFQH